MSFFKTDYSTSMLVKETNWFFQELHEPQTSLLKYVLEQSYSRELVCSMLGVSKQVSKVLIFPELLIIIDYLVLNKIFLLKILFKTKYFMIISNLVIQCNL